MNSRARAMTLLLSLVVAWGAIAASPFRAFAELVRDGGRKLAQLFGLNDSVAVLAAYFVALLVLTGLLLLSRSRVKHYVAPVCALAAFAYNLALSTFSSHSYTIALSTSIGLALALLFLLPKNPRPSMWLGDAFTMAIPAMVLFDAVLLPVVNRFAIVVPVVPNWIEWPTTTPVLLLDRYLGLDALLWGLILAAVTLLPTLLLTNGRPKG